MKFGKIAGHFIDGADGQLAVVVREPLGAARGCVLAIPPFAEEMNKCRRMLAEVSFGLARRGVVTVIPDLYGTGDSAGEFEHCSVSGWCDDIARARRWASAQYAGVTGLLAIRLGCSLAAMAIDISSTALPRSLFWQPVFDGAKHLKQFLRLRVVAGWMSDRKETVAELRKRLEGGEIVEVAGYRISGRLAADLEALVVPDALPSALGSIAIFNTSVGDADADRSPANGATQGQTTAVGDGIAVRSFQGEPFWASTEVVINMSLVEATVSHLCGPTGDGQPMSGAW